MPYWFKGKHSQLDVYPLVMKGVCAAEVLLVWLPCSLCNLKLNSTQSYVDIKICFLDVWNVNPVKSILWITTTATFNLSKNSFLYGKKYVHCSVPEYILLIHSNIPVIVVFVVKYCPPFCIPAQIDKPTKKLLYDFKWELIKSNLENLVCILHLIAFGNLTLYWISSSASVHFTKFTLHSLITASEWEGWCQVQSLPMIRIAAHIKSGLMTDWS